VKRYDRAYFDRWYRGADAARSAGALRRNVALAVAVAESVLDRPLASVLDVGCGEGRWQPVLAELRPDARYLGLDPSAWAVERFGAERNLHRGRFQDLPGEDLPEPFDLVVCADVLHYLDEAAVRAGIDTLADLVGGAALLEVFTAEDPEVGDREGFRVRPARWYRRLFQEAGLVPVGLQMWVHEEMAEGLDALDLP
jgi:SAM-dependent methyltransferase